MYKKTKFLLTIIALTSLTQITADNSCSNYNCDCNAINICEGYPFLQARSQGTDLARKITLPQEFINRYDAETTYGLFSITTEYSQSFNNNKLANFLFGKDLINCKDLYIQGGLVEDRNPNAWLSEYFGLPNDYNSKVSFCPKIQNTIIDLDLYLGLDGLTQGLYIKLSAPLVWTKWQLDPCEKVIAEGQNPYVAGYMSTTTIERPKLTKTFLQFMNGDTTFGDMQSPLKFGKIRNCNLSEFALAQINMELGYNFISKQNYNLGLSLYASAPTGTRPCATNLFEPIVGNGKHWELGVNLSGSWIFHRNKKHENRYIGLWLESSVTHLFKACQKRSFDFCKKPNSRYMLLEEMVDTSDYTSNLLGNTTQPLTGDQPTYTISNYQYAGNLTPAINWSTINLNVSIPIAADIAIKFGASRDNWDFDLGYNFWARSGEKFYQETCSCDTGKLYAIKGDATLYGKYGAENTIVPIGQTESNASIHGLTPRVVDNAQTAYYTVAIIDHEPLYILWAPVLAPITTSIQPILVNKSMLNLGKSPSSITHKIFTNISYAWKDRNRKFLPMISIGAFAEFSQDNYKKCCYENSFCENNCCISECNTTENITRNKSCNNCNDCKTPRGAVSLWGAWIRGGISFD